MRRHAAAAAVGCLLGATLLAGAAVALHAAAGPATLQRFRGFSRGYTGEPPDLPIENRDYNGRFTFNRVMFTPSQWYPSRRYMWGLDLFWNHDFPNAERNLMQILESITLLDPNQGGGNIYRTDDPEFFKYPFAYMSEPGYWTMSDEEARGLREFLLKGGLLIFDDFRGFHWWNFEEQIQRVLPGAEPVILDTTHALFHAFFDITQEDILGQYYNYNDGPPVIYGVFEDNDPNKRLLMIANYNQDVGEAWEFSNEGFIPIELSNNSYKLGVNYVIYSMTH